MADTKLYKTTFMVDGKGPSDLPELYQTCYGFSNWGGPREEVPYEDRDCSECTNSPGK